MASQTRKLIRDIKKSTQTVTPIGTEIILPNHSGDHSKGMVRQTPEQPRDLVNKKYVDDKFPVTHASTTGQTTDDHHAQSHNITSHSDTTATGTELNSLTDDSMADTLHRHSELSASDGDPNPALSVDATGNTQQLNGTSMKFFNVGGGESGSISRDDGYLNISSGTGGNLKFIAPNGVGYMQNSGAWAEFALNVESFSAGNTANSTLTFGKSASSTLGTRSQTASGEWLGRIYFKGCDSGNNWDYGAVIKAVQSGNAGAYVPTVLTLNTWSDSGENTGQLTLLKDGNIYMPNEVGIGASAARVKLHIASDATDGNQPNGLQASGDTHTGLYLASSGNALGEKYGMQFGGWTDYSLGGIFGEATSASGNSVGDITVDMRATTGATDLTEVIRIKNTGVVGIGTSTPNTSSKMQIAGTTFCSNLANNFITFTSAGSDYGQIFAPASDHWSLGHGANIASAGTSVITWNDAAQVGINNATPAQALDVTGNIAVSGTVDGIDIAGMSGFVTTNTTHRGLTNNPHTTTDANLSTSDVTTNNSSTSKHGFLKKLDNVATNFMNGQGNWAAPAGGTPTKEFFIYPCSVLLDGAEDSFMTKIRGSLESVSFNFHVPHDFTSLTDAVVVVIPDSTETIQWDLFCDVAAVGENFDNDARSSANETKAVTIKDLTELDVSAVLANLSAGDYVGLHFRSDTDSIPVIGFRFKYA